MASAGNVAFLGAASRLAHEPSVPCRRAVTIAAVVMASHGPCPSFAGGAGVGCPALQSARADRRPGATDWLGGLCRRRQGRSRRGERAGQSHPCWQLPGTHPCTYARPPRAAAEAGACGGIADVRRGTGPTGSCAHPTGALMHLHLTSMDTFVRKPGTGVMPLGRVNGC